MSIKKLKLLKKVIIILSGFVLLAKLSINIVNAQDIHFSQYYTSPLTLNPAETGFFSGNWRFSNNFRTQWAAIGEPFNTISVAMDKPFDTESGKLGVGLMYINDRSGSTYLTENKLYISFNIIRTYNNKHIFGFGVQPGYAVKSFSLDDITLPSQYNISTGTFDSSLPDNTETRWIENIYYGDINIGVNYLYMYGRIKPGLGIAAFHVNRPKMSFLREDNTLPVRYVLHGNADITINDNSFVKTNFLSMHQKKAHNCMFGLSLHFILPENNMLEQIFAGVHSRISSAVVDAVIFSTGLEIYNLQIGLSYDVNISSLAYVSNRRGAFEISVIYKDISTTLNKIALPCDRF